MKNVDLREVEFTNSYLESKKEVNTSTLFDKQNNNPTEEKDISQIINSIENKTNSDGSKKLYRADTRDREEQPKADDENQSSNEEDVTWEHKSVLEDDGNNNELEVADPIEQIKHNLLKKFNNK